MTDLTLSTDMPRIAADEALADVLERTKKAVPVVVALLMPIPSAAQSPAATPPANPQAPVGEASPTAPNAQGMMSNPGPGGPTQAPSGVPGSQNVNPGEAPRPMPPAPLPPDSPAPTAPARPAG